MNIDSITEAARMYGLKGAAALALLAAAWIASRLISRLVTRAAERGGLELTLARFLGSVVRYAILVPAVPACLGLLGVPTTSFAAVIAAAGLAIALAFQQSLANLAAGVMLLVFGPFKVGDQVTVAGRTGRVYQIALFATTVDTADNCRVIIPNSNIFGSVIENASHHATRRIDIPVTLDRRVDLERARAALSTVPGSIAGALTTPAPEIALVDVTPSATQWAVRVWTRATDYDSSREAAYEAIAGATAALTA